MTCDICNGDDSLMYVGRDVTMESARDRTFAKLEFDEAKTLCYDCREKFRQRLVESLDGFLRVRSSGE